MLLFVSCAGCWCLLLALVLWMGIYPSSFLDVMAPSVEKLIGDLQTRLAEAPSPSFAALFVR